MGLRDMKQRGGFLLPDARGGWLHYFGDARELARCPFADCKRAWLKVAPGRVVSTRVPTGDYDVHSIGLVTCRECKMKFEAAVNLPRNNPVRLGASSGPAL
jgi:hypothetical protein